MSKKLIRLTESDLHRIVKESVNRALNEISDDMLLRAHNAAVDDYNHAMLTSPYWDDCEYKDDYDYDDWHGTYPDYDKYYAQRRRQIGKFADALRDRGIEVPPYENDDDLPDELKLR